MTEPEEDSGPGMMQGGCGGLVKKIPRGRVLVLVRVLSNNAARRLPRELCMACGQIVISVGRYVIVIISFHYPSHISSPLRHVRRGAATVLR